MILVLEASTTSAKAMVYHPEKGTIRVLSKPYANAGEDRSLLDAGTVWRDILELGRQVVWDCKEEIELVSLSASGTPSALRPRWEPGGPSTAGGRFGGGNHRGNPQRPGVHTFALPLQRVHGTRDVSAL